MNTSSGPVSVDPDTPRHINTSRVTDEDMRYEDEEEEIISVVPAARWCAVVGERRLPLVCFVALDDASMYGVVIGEDGKVGLTNSVEQHPGFTGYEQATTSDKENN
jgi:hypothetical protein